MNNKRIYTAFYGNTEFEFESEHRAGSVANEEDAIRRARAKFGRLHNTVSGIALRPKTNEKPLGAPQPKNLAMTDAEKQLVFDAIAAGKITRIGSKLNGTMCVFSIKDAHGWSRSELERAITEEFYNAR